MIGKSDQCLQDLDSNENSTELKNEDDIGQFKHDINSNLSDLTISN
jgi:hypothetical protein